MQQMEKLEISRGIHQIVSHWTRESVGSSSQVTRFLFIRLCYSENVPPRGPPPPCPGLPSLPPLPFVAMVINAGEVLWQRPDGGCQPSWPAHRRWHAVTARLAAALRDKWVLIWIMCSDDPCGRGRSFRGEKKNWKCGDEEALLLRFRAAFLCRDVRSTSSPPTRTNPDDTCLRSSQVRLLLFLHPHSCSSCKSVY